MSYEGHGHQIPLALSWPCHAKCWQDPETTPPREIACWNKKPGHLLGGKDIPVSWCLQPRTGPYVAKPLGATYSLGRSRRCPGFAGGFLAASPSAEPSSCPPGLPRPWSNASALSRAGTWNIEKYLCWKTASAMQTWEASCQSGFAQHAWALGNGGWQVDSRAPEEMESSLWSSPEKLWAFPSLTKSELMSAQRLGKSPRNARVGFLGLQTPAQSFEV